MISRIRKLFRVLLTKGHDLNTEQGRATERKKRIAQTALAAMTSRAINILSGLITVPVTLPYLGLEQFGIWMALTGFVAFLNFTDLGISVGLQTALTNCSAKKDKILPSQLITNAFYLVIFIIIVLLTYAFYILPNVNITNVIKIENSNNELVLLHSSQALIITFCLGLLSGMVQRIFEAYQHGLYSNSLLAIGRVLGFISIYICIHFELSLPIMMSLYMGLPFLLLFIGGIFLFILRPWLRPKFTVISFVQIHSIMRVGILSLGAQIGNALISTGPLLLLTAQYGASAIVPYALTQRILGVVGILLSVILTPLWPAYGEAKIRGDFKWVFSTLKKSILFTISVSLPVFIFFTFGGQWLIQMWASNSDAIPTWQLLMICNIWMIFFSATKTLSVFLNGMESFKGQSIYGLLLPLFALYIGWVSSEFLTLSLCLMLIILIGELGRLMAMIIEIFYLRKSIQTRNLKTDMTA